MEHRPPIATGTSGLGSLLNAMSRVAILKGFVTGAIILDTKYCPSCLKSSYTSRGFPVTINVEPDNALPSEVYILQEGDDVNDVIVNLFKLYFTPFSNKHLPL